MKQLSARERADEQALALYERYASYREVGLALGMTTFATKAAVERALRRSPLDSTTTAKKVAIGRLNAQAILAQRLAEQDHIAFSNGRVMYVTDDEGNKEILYDRGINLQALDRLRQIQDQLNKITGIYAPATVRLEVVPQEVVERAIEETERLVRETESRLGLSPGEVLDVEEIEDTDKVCDLPGTG